MAALPSGIDSVCHGIQVNIFRLPMDKMGLPLQDYSLHVLE
jgi:hypothetical protein